MKLEGNSPKDFTKKFPCMSRLGKYEIEVAASAIMDYLFAHGDVFSSDIDKRSCVDWFAKQAVAGHHIRNLERYFDTAAPYCASKDDALEFCFHWLNIPDKEG